MQRLAPGDFVGYIDDRTPQGGARFYYRVAVTESGTLEAEGIPLDPAGSTPPFDAATVVGCGVSKAPTGVVVFFTVGGRCLPQCIPVLPRQSSIFPHWASADVIPNFGQEPFRYGKADARDSRGSMSRNLVRWSLAATERAPSDAS